MSGACLDVIAIYFELIIISWWLHEPWHHECLYLCTDCYSSAALAVQKYCGTIHCAIHGHSFLPNVLCAVNGLLSLLCTPGRDGGVARSSPTQVHDPPLPEGATSSGVTSGGVAPGNMYLVKFMWQPLTQKSYPKVTLLPSFKVNLQCGHFQVRYNTRAVPSNTLALILLVHSPTLLLYQPGSVDLTIDPENGNYYSEQVSIPSGRYEGQLVAGDSFIHPVKEFAVDNGSGGIVALELKRGTAIRYNYYDLCISQNILCG